MPAAYNENSEKPGLTKAAGATDAEFADYIKNITSVSVNGKPYAVSGRNAVKLFNDDGTIITDADPFKDAVAGTEFQITVASTGYTTPLTFTYKIAETPAPAEVDKQHLKLQLQKLITLKEADYTAESWSVYQGELQSALICTGSKGKSGCS